MHLVGVVRGIKHAQDVWQTFMQSQHFTFKLKDVKTGKIKTIGIQGAWRPYIMGEFVFPEEHLADVLTNMKIEPQAKYRNGRNFAEKAALKALQKFLGCEPLGDYTPMKGAARSPRFMHVEGVAFQPIGIRRDKRFVSTNYMEKRKKRNPKTGKMDSEVEVVQYEQEAL